MSMQFKDLSWSRDLSWQCACILDCLTSATNDEVRAGLERAIKTIEETATIIRDFSVMLKEKQAQSNGSPRVWADQDHYE